MLRGRLYLSRNSGTATRTTVQYSGLIRRLDQYVTYLCNHWL